MKYIEFPANTIVFNKGNKPELFYIILFGKVGIYDCDKSAEFNS